jgi:hypothetical protein
MTEPAGVSTDYNGERAYWVTEVVSRESHEAERLTSDDTRPWEEWLADEGPGDPRSWIVCADCLAAEGAQGLHPNERPVWYREIDA